MNGTTIGIVGIEQQTVVVEWGVAANEVGVGSSGIGGVFADDDIVEHRINDVASTIPFNDVRLSGLNTANIREGHRQHAVAIVRAFKCLHGGSLKRCSSEIVQGEWQDDGVPRAVAVESEAVERHNDIFDSCIVGDGRVVVVCSRDGQCFAWHHHAIFVHHPAVAQHGAEGLTGVGCLRALGHISQDSSVFIGYIATLCSIAVVK